MIHVCRVDVGSRHVFDSADGINDVGSLYNAIEQYLKIDKSKQILLIGGGEVLDDHTQKLYRLSAGREESPIYLIDKVIVEKDQAPQIEMPLENLNQDMKQDIQAAIALKPSFQTLQLRAQLASRVFEMSKSLHKICQSFYDDQYWQYQGFLALIANLDEFVSSFRKKEELICENFEKFYNEQAVYKDLMNDIDKYTDTLANIRLLPQLLDKYNEKQQSPFDPSQIESTHNRMRTLFSCFSSQSIANLQSPRLTTTASSCRSTSEQAQASTFGQSNEQLACLPEASFSAEDELATSSHTISLLDWIKSTDPHNKLNIVVDETKEMFTSFESSSKWRDLKAKISKTLAQIENNPQMKEIEGLTKRLQDLNNFLEASNKLLSAQNDIADSFKANWERASKLKDESILQDLCMGHEKQLELFKLNHSKMIEIASKISKAKLELVRVVHSRLHWVMQIQKQLADFDFQLQIYFKQLRRLNVRLKLLEQLKSSPLVYIYSIKETLRRQAFSSNYKDLACALASLLSTIYKNEMSRREQFNQKTSTMSQHFIINLLFRGLSDKIEPIVNELKLAFDNQLPYVDEADFDKLKSDVFKYLTGQAQTSNIKSTTSPNSSSSSSSSIPFDSSPKTSDSKPATTNENKAASSSVLLAELELVNDGQQNEAKFNEDLRLIKNFNDFLLNFSTSTSSQSCNKEHAVDSEHLLGEIKAIRQNLNETKQELVEYQTALSDTFKQLMEREKQNELESRERKSRAKQRRAELEAKLFEFISKLHKEKQSEEEFAHSVHQFEQLIDTKEVLVNEEEEEDNKDTKSFVSRLLHCLREEQMRNQKRHDELKATIQSIKINQNADKQIQFNEAIKRATQERDRVIDELRSKEASYLEQINALKSTVEKQSEVMKQKQQTEVSALKVSDDLASTNLNDEAQTKTKMRELMLTEKIAQLEKQVALFTTLPVTNDYETIQLNSCNTDDLVIAVYSDEHNAYKIIHKTSSYLHFVHSAIFKSHEQKLSNRLPLNSSMSSTMNSTSAAIASNETNDFTEIIGSPPKAINLNMPTTSASANDIISALTSNPMNISHITNATTNDLLVKNSPTDNVDNIFLAEKQPQWFVGRVLLKEFCIARRENNRFRVASGTRFYRVKLKPYNLS